ncbi:MAG: hypothetical protein JWM16_4173 [Verrucomicrobiales bacterium]|nr:hypothetical protein [Verrucomicrobiales bacterium]
MEIRFDTAFIVGTTEPAAAMPSASRPADSVFLSTTDTVHGALAKEAEIRPAQIARGRELFLTASYPSGRLVHELSNLLAGQWPKPDFLD